jgi:hypothetical protein
MPWKIEQQDDEFCVIKEADGEVEGCHDSHEKAAAQIAALNAAEEKGGDEDTKECMVGPVTFAELDAVQEALDKAADMQLATHQFQMLVGNVMSSSDIEDKGAAVEALAAELSQRMSMVKERQERWQPLTDKAVNFIADHSKQAPMKTEGGVKYPASDYAYVPDAEKPSTWKLRMSETRPGNITKAQLGRAAAAFSPGGFRGQKVQIPSGDVVKVKAKIRAAYAKLGVEPADIPPAVKERSLMVYKSGNTYRWAAIYSNNYRDRDNPREIISRDAHKDFVRAVDAGEWEAPELLWWHVKGKPLGRADLIFWDDSTNCAWAAGDFASKEIADAMATCGKELGVSHGMPRGEIERDPNDDTIITRYRSAEISFLPAAVAANPLTGLYSKEKSMNDDEQKLEALRNATGLDPVALGAEKKAEAEKQELESKEASEESPVEVAPQPVTAEDIAAVLQQVLSPLLTRIEALESGVKEMQAPAPEPPMPGASIMALLKDASIIGKPEAALDGRKARYMDKPTETEAEAPLVDASGSFFNSVMGPILDGGFAKQMNERAGVQ